MKNFKDFLNESTQAERDRAIAARSKKKASKIEAEINAGGQTPERRRELRKNLTGQRRTAFEKDTGIPFDVFASLLKKESYSAENDYEGEMASSELRNIISNAQDVESMLKPTTKLEAWVQSKITKANDYINSVRDYLKNTPGAVEEALDPVGKENADINNDGKVDETDKYLAKRRRAIAKAMAKRKGRK
jgi:hypothetical protein